eukprot:g54042.t1
MISVLAQPSVLPDVGKNLSPCAGPVVVSKKRSRPNQRVRRRQNKRLASGVQTVGTVGGGGAALQPMDGSVTVPRDPVPAAATTAATAEEVAVGTVVGGGATLRPIDGLGAVPPDPEPLSQFLWMSYSPRDGGPDCPLIVAFDEADSTGAAIQRCFPVDEVRNERAGQGYADREWMRFVDRVVAAGRSANEQAQLAGTVDSYEPPIFHPQGSGSDFPEGDTTVPCPIKNTGKAGCLLDAWLCALPRLQDSYIKWARRNLPGMMCLKELIALASYTDKEAGLRYHLVPISFRSLARQRKGVFIAAGQSHAVAVVCVGGAGPLIVNPAVCFAATLKPTQFSASWDFYQSVDWSVPTIYVCFYTFC